MPSAFGHALVGAALASVVARPRPAWLPVILAALAVAPDLDVVGFRLGVPYEHPLGHRGATHSLFFAALTALASLPLWRRHRPAQARQGAFLVFLAVASHGLLDTTTNGGLGIGLLWPFDDARSFAPWRPILTSPLSLGNFVSLYGARVLANEALWIGIPTCLFLLAVRTLRAVRSARGSA